MVSYAHPRHGRGTITSFQRRGYSANSIGTVNIKGVGMRELSFDAQLRIQPGDVLSFGIRKDRRSLTGAKAINVKNL